MTVLGCLDGVELLLFPFYTIFGSPAHFYVVLGYTLTPPPPTAYLQHPRSEKIQGFKVWHLTSPNPPDDTASQKP